MIDNNFPNLNYYFYDICTSTGKKIKKLSDQILQDIQKSTIDTVPYPYIDPICNKAWYSNHKTQLGEMFEEISLLKEKIKFKMITSKSKNCIFDDFILTWDQFIKIGAKHYFFSNECETVAFLLRHFGALHHYRDFEIQFSSSDSSTIKYPLNKLIFLDIDM